jgi:PAS domain-containing protein
MVDHSPAQVQATPAIVSDVPHLDSVIRSLPLAVVILDRNMRVLLANEQWLHDYGLRTTSVIQQPYYDLLPQVPPHWKDAHQHALAGQTRSAEQDSLTRVDGTVQYVNWHATPWFSSPAASSSRVRTLHQTVSALTPQFCAVPS